MSRIFFQKSASSIDSVVVGSGNKLISVRRPFIGCESCLESDCFCSSQPGNSQVNVQSSQQANRVTIFREIAAEKSILRKIRKFILVNFAKNTQNFVWNSSMYPEQD